MTVIKTSKRLEACAKYLCDSADSLDHATMFGKGAKLAAAENRQWAADIRSLIIPEPLNKTAEDEIGNSDLDDGC